MAALTQISGLSSGVALDVPGCADEVVLDALKDAFRQWCIDTHAWTEDIAITTAADEDEYTLTVTADDAVIERIEKVKYDDNADDEDLASYKLDIPDSKVVFKTGYIPSAASLAITVTVSLRPIWRVGSANAPAWIVNRWGRAIQRLASSELLALPKKPWTNPQFAVVRRRQYLDEMGATRLENKIEGTTRQFTIGA